VSETPPAWADDYYEQLESSASTYNDRAGDLFSVQMIWNLNVQRAQTVLENERVNLYITGESGTAVYSFRLGEDARIHDTRPKRRHDATVRVVVERAALERIKSEYTQTRAIRAAYLRGDITITGVGLVNWLEWSVINERVRAAIGGS
jgi:hypothetical protein